MILVIQKYLCSGKPSLRFHSKKPSLNPLLFPSRPKQRELLLFHSALSNEQLLGFGNGFSGNQIIQKNVLSQIKIVDGQLVVVPHDHAKGGMWER
jgi:hypothetical protein